MANIVAQHFFRLMSSVSVKGEEAMIENDAFSEEHLSHILLLSTHTYLYSMYITCRSLIECRTTSVYCMRSHVSRLN